MLTKLLQTVWDRLGATEAPASPAQARQSGLNPVPTRVTVVDDRLLLDMAQEPIRPLFPLIRDDVSVWPLVWLLAIVAPLLTLSGHTLTDNDALWGCRAIEGVAADRVGEFVDPASRDRDIPFAWQPPLVSWLTSGVLSVVGCERTAALFVIPWLSAAALVVGVALFARLLGGNRASFVALLLVACQPALVQATPRAAAGNAGLALLLFTLWGYAQHWNKSPSLISWRLVVGGICGGLCLLAGGPIAMALAAVIGAYLLWWHLGRRWAYRSKPMQGAFWGRRQSVASTGILAGIATLCCGGWLGLMLARYGLPFAKSWLGWRTAFPGEISFAPDVGSTWDYLAELSVPLFGILSLLGALRIIVDHRRREDSAEWRQRRLLLVWAACGLLIWLVGGATVHGSPDAEHVWRNFVVIPLLLLASVAVIEIADRRIPFELAFALLLAAIVWGVESGNWTGARDDAKDPLLPQLLRFGAAVLLAAGGFLLFHLVRGSRRQEARTLTAIIVAILAIHIGSGWRSLSSASTSRDAPLPSTRQAFRSLKGVRHVTLVSPDVRGRKGTPPLLLYFARSYWPRATVTSAATWEQAIANAPAPVPVELDPDADEPAEPVQISSTTPHVVIVWGQRGRVNLPPLLGPARRHGPVISLSQLDAALFVVPPPAPP